MSEQSDFRSSRLANAIIKEIDRLPHMEPGVDAEFILTYMDLLEAQKEKGFYANS